ncbi:MAG TPA: DUF58 domain-containing protein [Herpetosiphonaceae bacterium]|nr:DUF58 domain-containing protein [Herpetosiphonaceae bacterium]
MTSNLRLFAVFLLLAALALQEPLLAAAAFILGGATFITGWWTSQVERRLRVLHRVPETVSFGEYATVNIEVSNRSLLPVPWIQVTDSVPLALRTAAPVRLAFSLGAGSSRQMSYRIFAGRRGFYRLGPLRLVTGDVLGLHTRQLSTPGAELTVFPRVLPLQRLMLPAHLPFGPLASRMQRGEDPARPAGVRKYQASDGVRRLDWKSTARYGELLVRRAEPSIAPETTLALAFGSADFSARIMHDCIERGVTAAASLGAALLERKLPVGLVSNGVDPKHPQAEVVLPQGKGDGHRHLLLYLLGRLEPGEGPSLFDVLARQSLPWGGTLALIVADLEVDLLPQIDVLKRRGQHVVALLLEPTPGGRALAHRQGIPIFAVDRDGAPLPEQGAYQRSG